jgi:hypothetical protein
VERQVKPRRADDATRIALVALSWLIDWGRLLTVVKPDTLIRWHRKGFQLFGRCKFKASWSTAIAGGAAAADCSNGRGRAIADLEYICAKSRERGAGVRFLCGGYGNVPRVLHLHGSGRGHAGSCIGM